VSCRRTYVLNNYLFCFEKYTLYNIILNNPIKTRNILIYVLRVWIETVHFLFKYAFIGFLKIIGIQILFETIKIKVQLDLLCLT
jgi:hypothetical protein